MQVDPSAVGTRIRRARQAAGLAVKDLARRAHVSPSYLSDIERGVKHPSLAVAAALAQALGCTLDWLVFGRDPRPADLDLRALLRDPARRLSYHGEPLSEWDKERMVDLLDAAWGLRRRPAGDGGGPATLPPPGPAGPGGPPFPYPGESPAVAAWIRRAVADALSDYLGSGSPPPASRSPASSRGDT